MLASSFLVSIVMKRPHQLRYSDTSEGRASSLRMSTPRLDRIQAAITARNCAHICSHSLRLPPLSLCVSASSMSASNAVVTATSPATPHAEVPSTPQSWRFIVTGAPCEWAEDYRPGGFHPVTLGDKFRDGKYKVIRKLGNGSYSTVWLAVSTWYASFNSCFPFPPVMRVGRMLFLIRTCYSAPRYVALKIMVAKASTTSTELCILDHLFKSSPRDPNNAQHITTLLDAFQHQGPNGNHQCLVFEPMGATAASLVESLPENIPKRYGKPQRYPKWMAKKILLHTLCDLAFLHHNGIVHGDIQPGNLLFSIKSIRAAEEEELEQDEASTTIPLHRIDGKVDRWAPKNLYLKQPLHDHVQLSIGLCVKLSDFGSGKSL